MDTIEAMIVARDSDHEPSDDGGDTQYPPLEPRISAYVTAESLEAVASFQDIILSDPRAATWKPAFAEDEDTDAEPRAQVVEAARAVLSNAVSGSLPSYTTEEGASALSEALDRLGRMAHVVERIVASPSRADRLMGLSDIEPAAVAALEEACNRAEHPDGYCYETYPQFLNLLHSAARLIFLLESETQSDQSTPDPSTTDTEGRREQSVAAWFYGWAKAYLDSVYNSAFDIRRSQVTIEYTSDYSSLLVFDSRAQVALSRVVPITNISFKAAQILLRTTSHRIARGYADSLLLQDMDELVDRVFNSTSVRAVASGGPAAPYEDCATLASHCIDDVEQRLRFAPPVVDQARSEAPKTLYLEAVRAIATPAALHDLGSELDHVVSRANDQNAVLYEAEAQARSADWRSLTEEQIKNATTGFVKNVVLEKMADSLKTPLKKALAGTIAGALGPLADMGISLIFNLIWPPEPPLTEDKVREMIGIEMQQEFTKFSLNLLIGQLAAYDGAASLSSAIVKDAEAKGSYPTIGEVRASFDKIREVINSCTTNQNPNGHYDVAGMDSRLLVVSYWADAASAVMKEFLQCLRCSNIGNNTKRELAQQTSQSLRQISLAHFSVMDWIDHKIWINKDRYYPGTFPFLASRRVYDRTTADSNRIVKLDDGNVDYRPQVRAFMSGLSVAVTLSHLQFEASARHVQKVINEFNSYAETTDKVLNPHCAVSDYWFVPRMVEYMKSDATKRIVDWTDNRQWMDLQDAVNKHHRKVGRNHYPWATEDFYVRLCKGGREIALPPGDYPDLKALGFENPDYVYTGRGMSAYFWSDPNYGKVKEVVNGKETLVVRGSKMALVNEISTQVWGWDTRGKTIKSAQIGTSYFVRHPGFSFAVDSAWVNLSGKPVKNVSPTNREVMLAAPSAVDFKIQS